MSLKSPHANSYLMAMVMFALSVTIFEIIMYELSKVVDSNLWPSESELRLWGTTLQLYNWMTIYMANNLIKIVRSTSNCFYVIEAYSQTHTYKLMHLICAVLQGSVLSPILFKLYPSSVFHSITPIRRWHNFLYLSFPQNVSSAMSDLKSTVSLISISVSSNYLTLNP